MPPPQYVTEDDVRSALKMSIAIEAMEGAFQALAAGTAHNVPRVRACGKGIVLHGMSAAADYLQRVGWKQYTTTREGARFHVGLYDQASGEMIALIEADRLGQMRTGAVTGLAAKFLAVEGADEAAIVGAGWQAESQLAAVATALPLRRAFCFSRDQKRREAFAEKMSAELDLEVVASESSEAAVRNRPVVITATTSTTPVISNDWLLPTALVCAVGSNWLNKAELDVPTIQRASLVVCDSVECCQQEAGDFIPAIEQGVFHWDQAVDLADIVAGKAETQRSADRTAPVIFKSVGMAIEDVAIATKLLERLGLGD